MAERYPVILKKSLITDAVAEVRFTSNALPEQMFVHLYNKVSARYSIDRLKLEQDLTLGDISPWYKLSGENFILLLGSNTCVVGINNKYSGWEKFRSAIRNVIDDIIDCPFELKINRLGLRYIDFIDANIFEKMNFTIHANQTNIAKQPVTIRTVFKHGNYRMTLNIQNWYKKPDNPDIIGSLYDVDVDTTSISPNSSEHIFASFEEMHTIQKRYFYDILKPDFLEELGPIYDFANKEKKTT